MNPVGEGSNLREAITGDLAGWTPQGRNEVHGFCGSLPDMLRDLGGAMESVRQRMDDEHIHLNVREMLSELAGVINSSASTAEEVYASHRKEHELWLNDE